MSAEALPNSEQQPGEYEFSIVFGALKNRFAAAVAEQQKIGKPYRFFTLDHIRETKDTLGKFRLVMSDLVDDLEAAALNPAASFNIGLPLAQVDSDNPILLSDSPLGTGIDYFVLYHREYGMVVTPNNMKENILDADPGFPWRIIDTEVVPVSKPREEEV